MRKTALVQGLSPACPLLQSTVSSRKIRGGLRFEPKFAESETAMSQFQPQCACPLLFRQIERLKACTLPRLGKHVASRLRRPLECREGGKGFEEKHFGA